MLKKTLKGMFSLKSRLKKFYIDMPVKAMVAISLFSGLFVALWASSAFAGSTPAFGGDIVRIHVIANSDSTTDQDIKLKVRDAVLKYATPYLSDLENGRLAKDIIKGHLNGIEAAAAKELETLDVNQGVTAELGNFDFPVKTYGNVTLPAGKYRAVRVVIGEGKGKNWWCVMFPPLCMVDVAHSGTQEKAVKIIQQNMNDYDVLNGGQKRPSFRISFKLFEIFNNKKTKQYD